MMVAVFPGLAQPMDGGGFTIVSERSIARAATGPDGYGSG